MKKIYVNPRMTVIDCNAEVMQIRCSMVCGGQGDGRPDMGTDGEGDYGDPRYWNFN